MAPDRNDDTYRTLIAEGLWAHLDAPEAFPAEPELPDRYRLEDRLGRGGMGEVWRVWDEELQRHVALKLLFGASSPDAWERFEEEARVAAQLQHPGIIPVHDLGRLHDGRLWFTMKVVQGETLGTLITQAHRAWRLGRTPPVWTFRRLLDGMLRVCETLSYAHARGVVHRDMKPANIMFGAYGEVLVLDWGIAKVLAEQVSPTQIRSTARPGRTQAGTVSGTPIYMSPEQARGESHLAGPQADVYSLGATLYDLLCDRPPRVADDVATLLAEVSSGRSPIPAPSSFDTGAPHDSALDTLVLRALNQNPEERFPDAGALAVELADWLDGAQKRDRAMRLVKQAKVDLAEHSALSERAKSRRERALRTLAHLPPRAPIDDDKRAAWAAEAEADELSQAAGDRRDSAVQQLRAALTHSPNLPEAHAGLADLLAQQHRRLESEGRSTEARSVASDLAQHDTSGRFRAYLDGAGSVTLHTTLPAAATLYPWEESGRRLELGTPIDLGTTPLREVPLPMGSYLIRLERAGHHVVEVPVWIRREECWDGVEPGTEHSHPILLPTDGELAEDEIFVPGGWAWTGEDGADYTSPLQRAWVRGIVIQRHPVTVGDYCAYLNALRNEQGEAEAALAEPRVADDQPYLARDSAGHWTGIAEGIEGLEGFPRDPAVPITLVRHDQAVAYGRWLAGTRGQEWRLPTEAEWQHAARGADRRVYPWGDHFEPSWCQMRFTEGNRGILPVEAMPTDVSPYGVRGMAGNTNDWLASNTVKGRTAGGNAGRGPRNCRISQTTDYSSQARFPTLGFRLVRSLG